ncbi:MAG: ABC transporter substrate-binding protein [Thermodesulfobacteriota bacterium]
MKSVKSIALTISVAFVAWITLSQVAIAQDLKVRVGYGKTWGVAALLVGKAKGFFEAQGLKVTWLNFGSPNRIIQGIIADTVDVGASTGPHLVVAYEKGVKIKAVALGQTGMKPDTSYIVRTDANINNLKDLRGKRVGINNFGGNFDIYMRYMLEKRGLDPKKDVQFLEFPLPATIKGLLSKRIDVGAVTPPLVWLTGLKFKDKIKPLFSFTDVAREAGAKINSMIFIMSTTFIAKNRPSAKAFLRGYLQAIRFSEKNPSEAKKLWAKESGIGLVATMPQFPPLGNGKVHISGMQLDIRLMKKYGYIKAEPRAEELVDNSLIDDVLANR